MRIGIVNDLALATEAMRRVVQRAPEHTVAWTARDGAEAVRRCAEDRPDLVLMDLIMPAMDGVEATRRIMAATPCPILVVTATVEGNSGRVFEALGAGALDAVNTPVLGGARGGDEGAGLLAKIELLGRLTGAGSASGLPALPRPPAAGRGRPAGGALLALGASAGGPAALAEVLRPLPRDFGAAIVVVQHLDEQFSAGFAAWLGGQTRLPVRLAAEGELPVPGTVLVAGRDAHLVVRADRTLGYTAVPRETPYRPSVDVFFGSVADHWRGEVAAVLLTGMGRDGARGLKRLRDGGATTLAQDKATCAVYGMPKAAAELGAAAFVLPLPQIAPTLQRLFASIPSPPP